MNRIPNFLLLVLLSSFITACQLVVDDRTLPSAPTPVVSPWGGVTSPLEDSTVDGDVPIIGSANIDSFQKYELHFKPEDSEDDAYIYFGGDTTPIENDLLGTWETASLEPGPYTLRLRVVKVDGNYSEFLVNVVKAKKIMAMPSLYVERSEIANQGMA